MGTWGTGLYQDDTACEVRDEYVKHLKAGVADREAGQKIVKRFGSLLKDVQVACMVYLALADTQWNYGRLDPGVKKRALDLIRRGADLSIWERDNPKLVSSRRRALESLRKRLESKPRPRRLVQVVAPKPLKTWTDAKLGTVFLLPLTKSSNAALVLVGHWNTGDRKMDPAFSVLKWKGRGQPRLAELRGLGYVRVPEGSRPDCDTHIEIGFLELDQKINPIEGLTRTDVVMPKPRRFSKSCFYTGIDRLKELVAAAISGRRPPPDEWEKKFGRR
jgi:hypothetical protein